MCTVTVSKTQTVGVENLSGKKANLDQRVPIRSKRMFYHSRALQALYYVHRIPHRTLLLILINTTAALPSGFWTLTLTYESGLYRCSTLAMICFGFPREKKNSPETFMGCCKYLLAPFFCVKRSHRRSIHKDRRSVSTPEEKSVLWLVLITADKIEPSSWSYKAYSRNR